MDKPDRGDPRAMDLGELLTVLQAADWANLSVSTIRRRMEDGELRFEIFRDKGRDVQRIRWVDLCDLYPHILESAESIPESKAAQQSPVQTAPKSQDAISGAGTQAEPPAREPTVARETDHSMQLSVQSLTEQRDDLREQCYDLRIRLSTAEKERQASVGALLLAQKQILTIEGNAQILDPGPFWKRPRNWSLLAAAGIFLWALGGMLDRQKEQITEEHAAWSQSLAAETQERLKFQSQRLDSERRAMQEQLVQLNEHNEEQRLAIRNKLEEDQGDRKQLWMQVQTLGQGHSETQELVKATLDAEALRREQWNQEQAANLDKQWTQLRTESMEVLRSEMELERKKSLQQQEALAASWRQREQRAVLESERLAQHVGQLVARVEQSEGKTEGLKGDLATSRALNAAYKRNLSQDLNRYLTRTAATVAALLGPVRP
ncbi:MAG: hypothetical protein P1V35_10075 [Planctomycetota bacterium]|nr:hypothetical protein [Planctomycetota bacterium]